MKRKNKSQICPIDNVLVKKQFNEVVEKSSSLDDWLLNRTVLGSVVVEEVFSLPWCDAVCTGNTHSAT